ncbi:hypothetical protein RR48_09391 [Papilio machaon]|uniref:Uncharacterized protein n=1 Tax=Papilio machaon TaxID=76193 RepID=A0A194RCW4_PAPMA|nr:hypothetical protein RR48_09391 [Papilio machaon]
MRAWARGRPAHIGPHHAPPHHAPRTTPPPPHLAAPPTTTYNKVLHISSEIIKKDFLVALTLDKELAPTQLSSSK